MTSEQIRITTIEKYNSKAKITLSNSQIYYLPLEAVITHRLVESIVLTGSQVDLIEFESHLYLAYTKAKQYLAMRDHSSGQLKMKLQKKKFPDDVIKQTLSRCKKYGFLDDERYTYSIAEKLVAKKPCGKPYLISYLQTKLIPRELSERVASVIYEPLDIHILAISALEKKWQMYDQLALEDARNKSYNYLARQGFSFGVAKDAFEEVYNKKQEELNN